MEKLILIDRKLAGLKYAMYVYKQSGNKFKYLKCKIKYKWLERRKKKYERKGL